MAKRRAARLLGVSVQALEGCVARGLLPVVRKPGSTRELLDTEALVVLGEEVARRRDAGKHRGVVGASLRELDRTGRLPRKLRPNQPACELRRRVDDTPVGHPIRVAREEDLISMKEAAGRDLDRVDITALRMAQGLEE